MTRTTLRSALAGFSMSALIGATTFLWFFFAATFPGARQGADAAMRADMMPELRGEAVQIGLYILGFSVLYWLAAAIFGRGRMHALALPNALLAMALIAFLAVVANHFYWVIDTYCDQLPYSHRGFDITRIRECPSSATFFSGLSFLHIALASASLVSRIVLSRRRVTAQ